MTAAQEKFYWRLWAAARKARPDLDRHELHEQALGRPCSHKDFSNADFDQVKAAMLAVSQPANMTAQIVQQQMPAQRMRVAVALAAAAMGVGDEYVRGIARRMGFPWHSDTEHLDEAELGKLHIALKKECRRIWRTVADLRDAVHLYIQQADIEGFAACEIICGALAWPHQKLILNRIDYDHLITALGALKTYAAQHLQADCDEGDAEHLHPIHHDDEGEPF